MPDRRKHPACAPCLLIAIADRAWTGGRGAWLLPVLLLASALAGCEPAPVPDEPFPATVLDAPVMVATPEGDRLFLLTEQSLRRTEKRNRPSGRLMVDGSVTYSVRRHELWALDPATLAVLWCTVVQEYRPTAVTVAPRIVGRRADALWWAGSEEGAVDTQDGRTLTDAGTAPPGSEATTAVNAPWYFHAGPADAESGPLQFPDSRALARARDPDGHFLLHVSRAAPRPLRLDRIADVGQRVQWSTALPVARLHALSATDRALVFLGMADAGKVPGTDHVAQGSPVLLSVDIATGRVATLDVGEASVDAGARPPCR